MRVVVDGLSTMSVLCVCVCVCVYIFVHRALQK